MLKLEAVGNSIVMNISRELLKPNASSQNAEVIVHGDVWNEANAKAEEAAKQPGMII